jgi:hypothetical protein
LHHIVTRGIKGKAIFKGDTDRKDFIERLSSLLQETVSPGYANICGDGDKLAQLSPSLQKIF